MITFLSFMLYSFITIILTILLFPVVLTGDIIKLFEKPREMTEKEFIADLYNP